MTDQSSRFIPSTALAKQWTYKVIHSGCSCEDDNYDYELHLVKKASDWTRNKVIEACMEWLKGPANLDVLTSGMRHKFADDFFDFMMPLDKTDVADAARLRWMLNGNGYFLEEAGLCGHCGTEADRARREIDKQMAMEGNADE
jgi:hypothetical protein